MMYIDYTFFNNCGINVFEYEYKAACVTLGTSRKSRNLKCCTPLGLTIIKSLKQGNFSFLKKNL